MPDDLPDYRPVSRLAVAALAAGVGSSLVLFTPLVAMLPLIAIALSIAALASIRRSDGRMAGQWLALAGLALAVGFSAQAFTATIAESIVARQRATATVMAWVDAVHESRFEDAFAVSSPRALAVLNQEHAGTDSDMNERRSRFRELPAVQAVTACTNGPPRQASIERTLDGWRARVPLAECGQSRDLILLVAVRRVTVRGHMVEEWLVNDFSLDQEPF